MSTPLHNELRKEFQLVMLPVAYLTNVLFAVWMPMLIPISLTILRKRTKKKYTTNG